MGELSYIGDELDLFAEAHHWKDYWCSVISPFVGRRVLDVGAGLGATARLMAGRPFETYVALEPDPRLARRMLESLPSFDPAFTVMQGTIDDVECGPTYDTILYIDVLEHIEDDKRELRAAANRLEPAGRIIVLSPAHAWLFSPFDHAVGHFRRYTTRALKDLAAGELSLEKACYLDAVGMFASLANRLLLAQRNPTRSQIRAWDRYMVPASRMLDPLAGHRLGKSVVAVYRLTPPDAGGSSLTGKRMSAA